MSRSPRLFAIPAALVATVLLVLPLSSAKAADGVTTGWWWALQTKGDRLPSPLPKDAFPVSRVGPNYEKLPAVRFEIPKDASHGMLTLQQNSDPTMTVGTGIIVACPLVTPFLAKEAQVWSNRPAGDCSKPVHGVSDGSAWRFDLSQLVEQWASGSLVNHGVIFVPVATMQRSTFQVVFEPPTVGSLDFTAPQLPVAAPAPVTAAADSTSPAAARATSAASLTIESPRGATADASAAPELSAEAMADLVRLVEAAPAAQATTVPTHSNSTGDTGVAAPAWLAALLLAVVAGSSGARYYGVLRVRWS